MGGMDSKMARWTNPKVAVTLIIGLLIFSFGSPTLSWSEGYISPYRNSVTLEERQTLAFEIREKLWLEQYLKVTPKLSPKTTDWLMGELSTFERAGAVLNTEEYIIWETRTLIDLIDFLTKRILQNGAGLESDWILLAHALMDSSRTEYLGIICERKIVLPCPMGDFSGVNNSTYSPRFLGSMMASSYASSIVLGVIGPKFGVGFNDVK